MMFPVERKVALFLNYAALLLILLALVPEIRIDVIMHIVTLQHAHEYANSNFNSIYNAL